MADFGALLEGRAGLILGMSGRNSIGYECAEALTSLGAEVAVTSRPARTEVCEPLALELGCAYFALDALDEAALKFVADGIEERWGRLDFLVHTAMGVPERALSKPLVDLDRAAFHAAFDNGVYSLILSLRYLAPLLRRSAAPRVVALSSACAHLMTPRYHVAGMSKAALESALRYLAYELGPDGIMCNAVSPSLLATDGACRTVGAGNAARTHAATAARSATRLPLSAEHVTGAVAYLCSRLTGNMTAEVLTVDGGFSRVYFRA